MNITPVGCVSVCALRARGQGSRAKWSKSGTVITIRQPVTCLRRLGGQGNVSEVSVALGVRQAHDTEGHGLKREGGNKTAHFVERVARQQFGRCSVECLRRRASAAQDRGAAPITSLRCKLCCLQDSSSRTYAGEGETRVWPSFSRRQVASIGENGMALKRLTQTPLARLSRASLPLRCFAALCIFTSICPLSPSHPLASPDETQLRAIPASARHL